MAEQEDREHHREGLADDGGHVELYGAESSEHHKYEYLSEGDEEAVEELVSEGLRGGRVELNGGLVLAGEEPLVIFRYRTGSIGSAGRRK